MQLPSLFEYADFGVLKLSSNIKQQNDMVWVKTISSRVF